MQSNGSRMFFALLFFPCLLVLALVCCFCLECKCAEGSFDLMWLHHSVQIRLDMLKNMCVFFCLLYRGLTSAAT